MIHPIKTFTLTCLCLLITLGTLPAQYSQHKGSINAVTGDVSFQQKYDRAPSDTEDEVDRIQTHLEYVENELRNRDVSHLSPELQAARKQHLDNLRAYRLAGRFPQNPDYESEGVRKPIFIDKNGTACAVGYLAIESGHQAEAEYIAETANFAYVEDMDIPALDAWVSASGFTEEECAMIQPTYGGNAIGSCVDNNFDFVCLRVQETNGLPPGSCRNLKMYAKIDPSKSDNGCTYKYEFYDGASLVYTEITASLQVNATHCFSQGKHFISVQVQNIPSPPQPGPGNQNQLGVCLNSGSETLLVNVQPRGKKP